MIQLVEHIGTKFVGLLARAVLRHSTECQIALSVQAPDYVTYFLFLVSAFTRGRLSRRHQLN